jgi:hypothetical protein
MKTDLGSTTLNNMKKLLISLLSFAALTSYGASADLVKGVDLTGVSRVTGAQLNQLVDNAYPASNRGMIIVTNFAPSVTGVPRFTNYIWLDTSTAPPVVKAWDASTTNWVPAVVANGSITTAKLADLAVTQAKMAVGSVATVNIIDSAVTTAKITDLNVTTAKIADSAVTTGKILDGTILTADIADGQITSAKLAAGAVSAAAIGGKSIYGTNLVDGTITSINIASSGVVNSNIAVNAIQGTNIAASAIARTNLSFTLYTSSSGSFAMPAAGAAGTFTHTLGAVPTIVRAVLRCTTTDLNHSVGDEVNITSFQNVVGADDYPAFSVIVDATTATVTRGSGASTITGINKTTGAAASITTGNWEVKVYTIYIP